MKNYTEEITDITLFAAPFGFGPLGKAMAIAHAFKNHGYTTKILTDDIGLQIVKASGLEGDTYEYKKPLDLASLNTRIAISCMDISTPVIKSGVPLVLYDSLLWLRGEWEHLPKYNEDLYIAQRFFCEIPKAALNNVKDHLYLVDAVLPESSLHKTHNESEEKIVLYPGGLKSPHLGLVYQEDYLEWVLEAIIPALRLNDIQLSNFIVIMPPQLKNAPITKTLEKIGVDVKSEQKDLGEIIASAKAFIIAPGIETMLEACAHGKVPLYLPPYISPHIPQIIELRLAGIGMELCPSFNDGLFSLNEDDKNMGKISKTMLKYNQEKLYDDVYKQEIIRNLDKFIKLNINNTNRYPLGRYGANQIVNILEKYMSEEITNKTARLLVNQ